MFTSAVTLTGEMLADALRQNLVPGPLKSFSSMHVYFFKLFFFLS
jgi:hypothetical protein